MDLHIALQPIIEIFGQRFNINAVQLEEDLVVDAAAKREELFVHARQWHIHARTHKRDERRFAARLFNGTNNRVVNSPDTHGVTNRKSELSF